MKKIDHEDEEEGDSTVRENDLPINKEKILKPSIILLEFHSTASSSSQSPNSIIF